MASFTFSRSLLVLLFPLISLISISEAQSSFSLTNFAKNETSKSGEDISLYGDAKIVNGNGGSSISIKQNDSAIYKKPIDFSETESEYPAGFSTAFSFSISPNHSGVFGFVVFPVNGTIDRSLFQVKFDLTKYISVVVNGTTVANETTRNVTVLNLEKRYGWINYIASGRFIEVRLSKSGSLEVDNDPLISTRIDLSVEDNKFMVGMKTYSGEFNLYSWSLEARRVHKYEHSWAAVLVQMRLEEEAAKKRRRERNWRIATIFVSTFGCLGAVFVTVMRIRVVFKKSNLVMAMHEECGIKSKEFEYEKMEGMMGKVDAPQQEKK